MQSLLPLPQCLPPLIPLYNPACRPPRIRAAISETFLLPPHLCRFSPTPVPLSPSPLSETKVYHRFPRYKSDNPSCFFPVLSLDRMRCHSLSACAGASTFSVKKNVPWHILAPRRGCFGNHLPLRRVRILAERFCVIGRSFL